MRILVTGISGFVGSHIADELIVGGHKVYGIDDHSAGVYNTPEGVQLKIGKHLQDMRICPEVDAIVHAAAYADLAHNWDSINQRDKLLHNNECATLNLLEVMPDVPLIYLSSGSVYGSQCADGGLASEGWPVSAESPYAASKAACEHYVQAYATKKRYPWYVLRICNQMGARAHRGIVLDFVKMGRVGHIHARDDGSQRRSWMHVKDTAGAVAAILAKRPVSGVYNVANAELWSWRDLVSLMGFKGKLTHEHVRAALVGDPVDIRLATTKLDPIYKCERTIESAFQDALAWLKWSTTTDVAVNA